MNENAGISTRVVGMAISRDGETVMGKGTTTVSITDEGGGEFLLIEDDGGQGVRLNAEEVPALCELLTKLAKECRQ